MILHSPDEAPESSQHQLVLPLNSSMHLLFKPSLMTTTPGLRGYSPDRRNCFFPSERHLRFYNMYSQGNCISECFANLTLARCGCSPFSSPRESRAAETPCPCVRDFRRVVRSHHSSTTLQYTVSFCLRFPRHENLWLCIKVYDDDLR